MSRPVATVALALLTVLVGPGCETITPQPEPPPMPVPMPGPMMTFTGYTPDGGELLEQGWAPASTSNRDLIIQVLPKLSAYGFRRYVTPVYMGIARSEEDAAAYFAPILDAAKQADVKFVPGLWLHHLIQNVYGAAAAPPWNVTMNPEVNHHPKLLEGLLDQAFWDELVTRSRILARGAKSDQVYFDAEEIFWKRRYSSKFWTAENLAAIRPMLHDAITKLHAEGIFLIFYHPYCSPWVPELRAIANALFQPENADDELTNVEHFGTDPYYFKASWIPAEPGFVDQFYTDNRYLAERQVRFGFISSHAVYPAQGLYGFTPRQFHDYLQAHPGVSARTWYVSNHTMLAQHAAEFASIAAGAATTASPKRGD